LRLTDPSSHGRREDEEDITIERLSPRDAQRSLVVRDRSRSRSRARFRDDTDDYESAIQSEARALNARAMERAFAGEARDGATRDWAIVDVPPGTERVRMDGAGGGAQEITWRRFNGVRRSRFIVGDRAYDDARLEHRDRALERRERDRADGMWTEITKDLVSRDAIEAAGLEYEETEYFFYVMEYLQYVRQTLGGSVLADKGIGRGSAAGGAVGRYPSRAPQAHPPD
jgi:hypothetical protein